MKVLKSALVMMQTTAKVLQGVCYNNIGVLYSKKGLHEEAVQNQKESLATLENKVHCLLQNEKLKLFQQVYKEIDSKPKNKEGRAALRQNPEFIRGLNIMLNGYINMGRFLETARIQGEKLQPIKFYHNGFHLSKSFLGKSSRLSKIFNTNLERTEKKNHPPQPQATKSEEILNVGRKQDFLPEFDEPNSVDMQIERRRSSNDFLIRTNSSILLSRRSSDIMVNSLFLRIIDEFPLQSNSQLNDENESSRLPYKNRFKVGSPISRKTSQSTGITGAKRSNNLGITENSTDKLRINYSVTPFQNSTEVNIEKIIEEKVEQGIRRLKNEDFGEKYQRKLELELKIEQLRKEHEEVRFKKEKSLIKLHQLKLKAKFANNNPEFNGYKGPTPFGYPPFGGYVLYPCPVIPIPVEGFPIAPGFTNLPNPYMSPEKNKSDNGNADDEIRGAGGSLQSSGSLANLKRTKRGSMGLESQGETTPQSDKADKINSESQILKTPKLPGSRMELLTGRSNRSNRSLTSLANERRPPSLHCIDLLAPNKSIQYLGDEGFGAPLIKAETFGSGALGQLITEFRKGKNNRSPTLSRTELPEAVAEEVNEAMNVKNMSAAGTNAYINSMGNTTKADTTKAESMLQIQSRNSNMRTIGSIPSLFLGLTPSNQLPQHEERSNGPSPLLQRRLSSVLFKESLLEEQKTKESERSSLGGFSKELEQLGKPSAPPKKSRLGMKRESLSTSIDFNLIKSITKVFPSMSKIDFEPEDDTGKYDFEAPNDWHDSIHEIITQTKPFQVLEHLEQLFSVENIVVRQPYLGLRDRNEYNLECHYIPQFDDPKIRVVLAQRSPNLSYFTPLTEEIIRIKDLTHLMKQIDYKDVIMGSSPVKSIRNFQNFIKHFLFPFIWVILFSYISNCIFMFLLDC